MMKLRSDYKMDGHLYGRGTDIYGIVHRQKKDGVRRGLVMGV